MKNKKAIAGAVAAALAAPVAFGAIDDQGMQYVTAGEGLGGSLRVDVLLSADNDDGQSSKLSSAGNSIRLWVAGDSDLGGGLSSTYYVEFRDTHDGNASGAEDGESGLYVDAFDVGLKGPFGEVDFGLLGMVAYRLVPSASLAFERGSRRESFGADPRSNGIRYESPVINGFQFGASGIVNEANDRPGTLDEFSLAARYSLPVGLQVGVGFENRKNEDVPYTDTDTETPEFDTETAFFPAEITVSSDSSTGFRFGARYGQDNWLVAYEYRGYDNWGFGSALDYVSAATVYAGSVDAGGSGIPEVSVADFDALNKEGSPALSYDVHAFGAMATVDRLVLSANYSTETTEGDFSKVDSDIVGTMELKRDTIALDAAYKLGSRSTMVLGWRNDDHSAEFNGVKAAGPDKSETYLFYRVDF